jgi:hypothetical protein
MEFTAEEQRSFIKIQFSRNVSVQEITAQLSEACGEDSRLCPDSRLVRAQRQIFLVLEDHPLQWFRKW